MEDMSDERCQMGDMMSDGRYVNLDTRVGSI